MNRKGATAEQLAAVFLERQGLVIVARNYRCRLGEIDLIARDSEVLVFVEVRQRKSGRFGGAAESITVAKRSRIVRAARHYLARSSDSPPCRFDALLLEGDPPRTEWIRGAFEE